MRTVDLQLDDDLVSLLRSENKTVEASALEFIVLGLYARGRLSSGKAAEILRMERIDFIKYASSLGIPYFNLTPEELQREVAELDKQWQGSSSATPVP
jgi:predicted HTH domain antitoxin